MPIIINLTVVYADWKEVWCNAEKRNWTITYFTSVLVVELKAIVTILPIHEAQILTYMRLLNSPEGLLLILMSRTDLKKGRGHLLMIFIGNCCDFFFKHIRHKSLKPKAYKVSAQTNFLTSLKYSINDLYVSAFSCCVFYEFSTSASR